MFLRNLSLPALAVLALVGTAWAGDATESGFVSVAGSRFIDPEGRHLLLHGVNVVDKSATWAHYDWLDESGYAEIRDWGFNCIRLGFTWASVEPEPGKYSEQCLAEIEKRVTWAARHGLYVLLDMHQDLYGMKYSDGAPEWATLTDGQPHVTTGGSWGDAYYTSPAVQTAFDNFYANKPGPDGVGLQEHYAGAWRFIAEHFANNPAVIGYDLMNEPAAGSLAQQGILIFAAKFVSEVVGKEEAATDIVDLMAKWETPEGRSQILKTLEDIELYERVLNEVESLFNEFERTTLTALFQRVTDEIRKVDKNHIIFLETCLSANMGMRSAIEPMMRPDGNRDALQAYAPHGYDLVTDTAEVASPSNARVDLIFSRHAETAKRLDMPMLVGEWGAYYGGQEKMAPAAQFVCRKFETLLCGDTYWSLERNFVQQPVLQAISRPYPLCVAGTILAYEANPDRRTFSCTWREEAGVTGESQFFVPGTYAPVTERVTLLPEGKGYTIKPVRSGCENVYVTVPSTDRGSECRLVIE